MTAYKKIPHDCAVSNSSLTVPPGLANCCDLLPSSSCFCGTWGASRRIHDRRGKGRNLRSRSQTLERKNSARFIYARPGRVETLPLTSPSNGSLLQSRRSRRRHDHAIKRIGLQEALRVLAAVAAEDADYASRRNGRGFSRSDQNGHALARCSIQQALADEALASKIFLMAKRYSRQALTIAQLQLL